MSFSHAHTHTHTHTHTGYESLFVPIIQAVMSHYRPTCIVLQVIEYCNDVTSTHIIVYYYDFIPIIQKSHRVRVLNYSSYYDLRL